MSSKIFVLDPPLPWDSPETNILNESQFQPVSNLSGWSRTKGFPGFKGVPIPGTHDLHLLRPSEEHGDSPPIPSVRAPHLLLWAGPAPTPCLPPLAAPLLLCQLRLLKDASPWVMSDRWEESNHITFVLPSYLPAVSTSARMLT